MTPGENAPSLLPSASEYILDNFAPTKKLAERKLAETLADVNDIDYRPRPIATVRDFVEMKYKKLILPLRKRTTQHGYKIILAHHIFPAFGPKQLVAVTRHDAHEFFTGNLARPS